ncbi:zinc ribbon domain-containing protein [Leptospira sp. 201903075]|uniref:FmdB family zinc ribbon protein n=1 Tax=Leptospira chreensis TaxID=2810035 RepID=UPI0019644551|nr:FmdB family zinc ribbon protein [Leptospira chreensis]MBM9589105.1 zinc ribbon domain-containing protein [Leptospira chreensis]
MATYDYHCNTCEKDFEHVQSMKEDALTHCLCGKNGSVERRISASAGIIFKGTGFYVTDYKKSGSDSTPPPSTGITDSGS